MLQSNKDVTLLTVGVTASYFFTHFEFIFCDVSYEHGYTNYYH